MVWWKISLSQLSLFKNGGGHPSGYLRVCHGKIHHAIKNGQPSISIRAIEKPWQTVGHNQRVPWSSMVYLNCRVGMIHPWRPWGVCSNPEPTEPTQLEWPAHRLPGSFQQIGPRWPSRLGQLIFRGFTHIKATSDWSMFIYDFSTDNLWFSIDLWFSHWWPMIIEESFLMISLWPMAPWHHGTMASDISDISAWRVESSSCKRPSSDLALERWASNDFNGCLEKISVLCDCIPVRNVNCTGGTIEECQ